MTLHIITNNQSRLLLDWDQLTLTEQAKFDGDQKYRHSDYFRYKGGVYDTADFLTTYDLSNEHPFRGWDGYHNDSFFSGILVKYDKLDNDRVIVGMYLS